MLAAASIRVVAACRYRLFFKASAAIASICGSPKLLSQSVCTGAALAPWLVHWPGTLVEAGKESFTACVVFGGRFTAHPPARSVRMALARIKTPSRKYLLE